MKHLIAALAVTAALSGYVFGQTPGQQTPGVQAQTPATAAAVYEAVVRYQIKSWDLGAATYCVRMNGEDADKEFLRRLSPMPVKGASECEEKQRKLTMSVIDKHSKKRSVIFGVGAILWRKDTEAEVEGGYLCGSQCMAGGIYHVVLDGAQWRVTAFKPSLSE